MRPHLIACSLVVAATVSLATSQTAHAAPWCSTYGGMSCGYYTFDQCIQSIRGVGGNCVRNPRESGGGGEGAATRRSRGWGDSDETRSRSTRRQEERKARQEEARKAREEEERRDRQEEARKARQEDARKARLEEERKEREEERRAKRQQEETKPAKPVETAAPKPAPVPATPAQPAPTAPAATPAAIMPSGMPRKPSAPDARVYFVGLQNGADVPSEVTLRFGVVNMGVAPAGLDNPNTGHHHLLIDTTLPALDQPIPSDFNHLHFGAGQTEATVTLPPGKHKLQLLFADENHVPHNPPVMSEVIEVTVKAKK